MRVEGRFVEALRALGVLKRGTGFLVACSGGLDSTVLASLCAGVARRWDCRLTLACVDHGLRADAPADVDAVRALAAALGADFATERVDVASAIAAGASLQDAARALRYDALERMRLACGADWILTAHHADDQAETMLMHFARGAGIDGLRGIRGRAGRVARPLLFARKRDLEQVARAASLAWREDSSNAGDDYTRNAVRHHVLPAIEAHANPSFTSVMRDTAELFASMSDYVDQETVRLEGECVEVLPQGVSLAVQPLMRYFDFQQLLVIRRAIRLLRSEEATYDETRAVQKLLRRRPGSSAQLRGACSASRERDHIVLGTRAAQPMPSLPVALGMRVALPSGSFTSRACSLEDVAHTQEPCVEFIDVQKSGTRWKLRPWRSGDRFRPVNGGIEKKLSDLFADLHIPRERKHRIPILEGDGGIIWICGIRLDDRFKVTAESAAVARIEYTQEME
ncbi:MAG: tRNA lysidine(34) synthetase TilS [Ignavibacteria bacterium]|nr:tRNA lysidine(34) synthetase TilS [Ignavibacteria bacterium]